MSKLMVPLFHTKVSQAVFTVNANWEITSFNKYAEKIFGLSVCDVVGKNCHEVFNNDDFAELFSICAPISEGRSISDIDLVIKNVRTNRCSALSVTAVPIPDNKGGAAGAVVSFKDSSLSSNANRLILNSIADGVFTVDCNWKITSFNRAAEIITGWSAHKAIGNFCGDVFHSSLCGRNCAIAQSLYSGKPVVNRSISIKGLKGNKIPISISASPLTDSEGNIIGGVETFRDLTAINQIKTKLKKSYSFDEIISKSPLMQRLFTIMTDIAQSPSNVLILGESGTGKELVARALHNASERKNEPFVAINCGALPESLLESELFGYKAGAFTDAKQDKAGRFAAAEGGTLFLDEIGDIPGALQVKLLRVLQSKTYEPLGSNTPVKTNVRIITATNRDLQASIQEGSFREDLFYRLNVVKITLPSLKERKEDIPLLIDHFIQQFSLQQGKDIVGISNGAMSILMQYDYPGNIRELENIIEYAFILCNGGFIQPEHLPDPFVINQGSGGRKKGCTACEGRQTLEETEKIAIYLALERNNWKRMATCRELSISKDTLRRKIKAYNLVPPEPGDQELLKKKGVILDLASERRQHDRHLAQFPLSLATTKSAQSNSKKNGSIHALTLDISSGGMKLHSREPLPHGKAVDFTVTQVGSMQKIRGQGEVKWTMAADGNNNFYAGVAFKGDPLGSNFIEELKMPAA
jgi:PAS domain S-box-containing protein